MELRNPGLRILTSSDGLNKTTQMQIKYLILTVFLVTNQLPGQEVNKDYKPINLNEAIIQLDLIFPDSTKQKISQMEEREFLGKAHLSTGMWIRNNWGLWKGGDLLKYFNGLGIHHPDDMSGIILCSYYRHLKNLDYELDSQIKFYQDYWEKTQEHEYKMKNDPVYASKFQQENDSIEKENIKKLTSDFIPGTRIKGWASYSDGIFSGGSTQIEGEIIEWQGIKAKVKIDKFLDERKRLRVLRYNKVKDNEIFISYYLLDKI